MFINIVAQTTNQEVKEENLQNTHLEIMKIINKLYKINKNIIK